MGTDLFDLTGKTALVTGGGTGLGRIMAEALAEQGADVAVCSRNVAHGLETAEFITAQYGRRAKAYSCNVSVEEEVIEVVRHVIEDFGQINILINNSGTTWGEKAEEMPYEAWKKVMDVNLGGTFLMSKYVGRQMIQNQEGKIINIGSVAGIKAEPADVLNAIGYSTSKAGVHHFTRDLARKWGEYGINVNAIAPGFFESKMTRHVLSENQEKIIHKNPLKRLGDPDSLKGAVMLLASRASDHITGQIIAVDGGSSL
ncbi:SDR family oxidoreductase [Pradoshia sp.]